MTIVKWISSVVVAALLTALVSSWVSTARSELSLNVKLGWVSTYFSPSNVLEFYQPEKGKTSNPNTLRQILNELNTKLYMTGEFTIYSLVLENNDEKISERIQIFPKQAVFSFIEQDAKMKIIPVPEKETDNPIQIDKINPGDKVTVTIITQYKAYDPMDQITVLHDNKRVDITPLTLGTSTRLGLTDFLVSHDVFFELLLCTYIAITFLIFIFVIAYTSATQTVEGKLKLTTDDDLKKLDTFITYARQQKPYLFNTVNLLNTVNLPSPNGGKSTNP